MKNYQVLEYKLKTRTLEIKNHVITLESKYSLTREKYVSSWIYMWMLCKIQEYYLIMSFKEKKKKKKPPQLSSYCGFKLQNTVIKTELMIDPVKKLVYSYTSSTRDLFVDL